MLNMHIPSWCLYHYIQWFGFHVIQQDDYVREPSKWSHGWFELLVYTISDTSQVTTPVQSLQSLIANCFWFQMSGRHFLERWHTVDDSLSHYFRILGWLLTQGLGLQSNAALAGQMHEVVRPVGLVFGWCKNRIGCKDTQKAMNQKKQFKGTLVPIFFQAIHHGNLWLWRSFGCHFLQPCEHPPRWHPSGWCRLLLKEPNIWARSSATRYGSKPLKRIRLDAKKSQNVWTFSCTNRYMFQFLLTFQRCFKHDLHHGSTRMDQFCVFQIFTAGLRPTTGWCGVAQIPCLGRQMVGSKCMSSPPAENEVCAAAISSNPAKHSISDGLRCWTNDKFQTSDWVVLSVYSWIFGLFDNFLGDGFSPTKCLGCVGISY